MLLFSSCKLNYKTASFESTKAPEAPNYSFTHNWACLPGNYPSSLIEISGEYEEKAADVFFVYPTLLLDRKNPAWNADIKDSSIRESVLNRVIKYQASAWVEAANLYVPFYRQSHYKVYVEPHSEKEPLSREIAYADVRAAFTYYLDNFNQGKPIIIASHSQGSLMALMLIKEFFDGTELQNKLIGAYVPGVKVLEEYFDHLKKMDQPDATGGYVSWNTYKMNVYPKEWEKWYKGGVVSNPVTWDRSKTSTFDQHLGVLYTDDSIYSKSLEVKVANGLLWTNLPRVPKRFWLRFIKRYHFADINLFWKDIEHNALIRSQAWFSKQSKNAR